MTLVQSDGSSNAKGASTSAITPATASRKPRRLPPGIANNTSGTSAMGTSLTAAPTPSSAPTCFHLPAMARSIAHTSATATSMSKRVYDTIPSKGTNTIHAAKPHHVPPRRAMRASPQSPTASKPIMRMMNSVRYEITRT